MRPTAGSDASRGELAFDCAKVEGLRFELDIGIWRGDAALIARCLVDDAEYVSEADATATDADG